MFLPHRRSCAKSANLSERRLESGGTRSLQSKTPERSRSRHSAGGGRGRGGTDFQKSSRSVRPRKEKAGGHTLGELPGFPMPQFLCLLNDSSSAVHPGLLRCYDLLSPSENVLKKHFVNIMHVLRISTVWWPMRNQRGLERLSLQKALSPRLRRA